MTTIAFPAFAAPAFPAAPAIRFPHPDFSRHAALAGSATGAALRFGAALVPFAGLAWLFLAF